AGWRQGGCVNNPHGGCAVNTNVSPVPINSYLHVGLNVIAVHVSNGECCESDFVFATNVPIPPPVVVLVHGYDNNADAASCAMEPVATYIENSANMGGNSLKAECLWYRTREGVVA